MAVENKERECDYVIDPWITCVNLERRCHDCGNWLGSSTVFLFLF
jgi:hypothetical protein